jgi:hypothetical protein
LTSRTAVRATVPCVYSGSRANGNGYSLDSADDSSRAVMSTIGITRS